MIETLIIFKDKEGEMDTRTNMQMLPAGSTIVGLINFMNYSATANFYQKEDFNYFITEHLIPYLTDELEESDNIGEEKWIKESIEFLTAKVWKY